MKKNNQGFMLAEVIIVTTVLVGVMVTLYTGFNRIYSAYELRNKYYDVDTLYAAKTINDYLIDELVMNKIINDLSDPSLSLDYLKIMTNGTWNISLTEETIANEIIDNYDIINIYLVKDKNVEIPDINQTFIDYLTYLSDNITSNNYLLIIERNVVDDYYYTYLEVIK